MARKYKNIDLGTCPYCREGTLIIMKGDFGRPPPRWAECDNKFCKGGVEINGKKKPFSFPIPKRGKIVVSGLHCPLNKNPIVIINPNSGTRVGTAYFWAGTPCYSCKYWTSEFSPCEETDDLIVEFSADEVYGWDETVCPQYLLERVLRERNGKKLATEA